mmetsp:Transcript_15652/g.48515  ORF Transcript_15652/g.48515 Transcript_15652/m.48515 type:complete len:215 (-) Transcript_15652:38-682(-)
MASYTFSMSANPTPAADPYAEDYDWVINKLRARGFKTLQDRRAEAEEQRKQRLDAWEAEKARRRAMGEHENQQGDEEQNPSWWKELGQLPGAEKPKADETKPYDLMTDEEKEEKRIRDKWGGTLAESVPLSDLKTLNTKGYIPRSQATCFRCGEKGHWSRDCPQGAKAMMEARGNEESMLGRDRQELRGRDARMYDKQLMTQREQQHRDSYMSR